MYPKLDRKITYGGNSFMIGTTTFYEKVYRRTYPMYPKLDRKITYGGNLFLIGTSTINEEI